MFDILKEHKHRGKQIFILAKNELVKTHKGSLLGPAWAIIKPLFTLFIYWFGFEIGIRGGKNILGLHGETMPFFIFMLPGFAAWFFMSDSILGGSRCIVNNSQYVKKMSFPVSTIMTFTSVSNLFVHFVLVAIMYTYLLIAGYGPSIYNIQFLYYCPMMFIFFVALSWSTATMSAFSKDFKNLISSIMTGFFWLSGIIWNSYQVDIPWLKTLMLFNPINYFANGYRKAFIYNEWFFTNGYRMETVIFLVELLAILLLGAYNYKRLRKTLPDVL